MVGLWVYFILSFVVSSFSKLCEYKSENNFVSRIENPLLASPYFQGKIQTLQRGQWGSLWPGYPPSWLTSPHSSLSVSWRALRRSPPVVPSLALKVQASPLVPAASCLCLSARIPSHCNRTRLSSSLPDLNPPAGSRESPLPLRAQHLSQHLVPSCAEWKHMKGKRRAERTGGETERVPYWQKETARSFYTLPAEAAFPAEPSCASTSERSSDFEVPVAPSRGTLANASSAPLFFLPVLYLQD